MKTKPLFKAPPGYPNAVAIAPEGLWVAEQKAQNFGKDAKRSPEACWLLDWNGKLIKTVLTESCNTSGMAYGDGYIWMGANGGPEGIYQTDMNSKTVSHRQIPLGPPDNGGGCHGLMWHEGKLWIVANRLRAILRVDPKSWEPEFIIPITTARWHGIAWDNGSIWMVTGSSDVDRFISAGRQADSHHHTRVWSSTMQRPGKHWRRRNLSRDRPIRTAWPCTTAL